MNGERNLVEDHAHMEEPEESHTDNSIVEYRSYGKLFKISYNLQEFVFKPDMVQIVVGLLILSAIVTELQSSATDPDSTNKTMKPDKQ